MVMVTQSMTWAIQVIYNYHSIAILLFRTNAKLFFHPCFHHLLSLDNRGFVLNHVFLWHTFEGRFFGLYLCCLIVTYAVVV